MRTLLSLAALVLLVAPGCGDDNNNTPDMTMAPADMAAPTGDMSKYQTCAQILSCAAACGQNQTCALGCATNAVSTAQTKFLVLGQCVLAACGPGDGGMHACTGATDTSTGCATCIGTVGAQASQVGKPCYAEFADCASH
jgi:hypothetical protein